MRAAAFLLVLGLGAGALGCRSCKSPPPEPPPDAGPPPSSVEEARRRLTDEALPFLQRAAAPTGRVHDFELVAKPTTLTLLDGRALDVWAYNDQVPGPTLRVRVGDTIRARLKNELPQPTTIHWHGVRLPNAMDGVPWVTQPPVLPGESFLYEFIARDPGTFWFHPHVRGSEQVERGLYGVLIVEPEEPLSGRDLVWVLDDWLLDERGQIDPRFVTPRDLAHDGRWGDVVTVNGQHRPELAVTAGERTRVRIVNVANGRVFALDLSGLDARVVAFDGLSVGRTIDAGTVELAPGNRVDLALLPAAARAGQTLSLVDRFTRREHVVATVRVERGAADAGGPKGAPAPLGFVPSWKEASELPADQAFALNARRGGPFGVEWMINERVMRHDDDDHAKPEHHEVPYRFERNRFVKLRFANDSPRLHPMHLHGVFFKVLARDGVPVDEGHWRDTVLVRPRETIDVGTVPTEPGTWMLHCHILEHADSGMMTLFSVPE